MSIHKDHRNRVKKRFLEEGLDSFDQVHALELLLYFGIPQGDTNPLAHDLIERFGSIAQVLETPPEELQKVSGVGPHVATLLSLITEISRYYMVNRTTGFRVLNTTEACGRYLLSYFVGRRDETVFLLCLDAKCKVIGCREVGQGSVNSAGVSIRKVVEVALSMNATSVVLAHNHPSGLAVPSAEDVYTTKRLALALDGVDVILADHIVVADDDFTSMVQSGLYDPKQCRLTV